MKGIIFTHFFEMVETEFGDETVEILIDSTETSTKGVYTSAGNYPPQDIFNLVTSLSQISQLPQATLYRHFGKYLFAGLYSNYSIFPPKALKNSFSFLDSVNDYIHSDVYKLHPNAELPRFSTHYRDEQKMVLAYQSNRRMSDLAFGLIEGCLAHFGEKASIEVEFLKEDGSEVLFTIKLNSGEN